MQQQRNTDKVPISFPINIQKSIGNREVDALICLTSVRFWKVLNRRGFEEGVGKNSKYTYAPKSQEVGKMGGKKKKLFP